MGVNGVCDLRPNSGSIRSFNYVYDPKEVYDKHGRKRNVCYEPIDGLPIDNECEVKEPSCSLNRSYPVPPKLYRYNYPCQVDVHGKPCSPPPPTPADCFLLHDIPLHDFSLRGSRMNRQCECKMRNGLQSDCKRYSYGHRVVCKCPPLPEILKPAGLTSYEIIPADSFCYRRV